MPGGRPGSGSPREIGYRGEVIQVGIPLNGGGPLLNVTNLSVHFHHNPGLFSGGKPRHLRAVDDISFAVYPRETLGLIGESGCGKTTAGKALIRLVQPTGGRVVFDGVDITGGPPHLVNSLLRNMQMIFQDPAGSLHPHKTLESAISEPLKVYRIVPKQHVREKVSELLELVGLGRSFLKRYPAELSGGQKQRVAIARCLAVEPSFIICDEAVSALDVSVRAHVLHDLLKLQEELGLTYLFISHDLATVRQFAHRIAIMYLGKLVEIGDTEDLFNHPIHPYTRALLSAIPVPDPSGKKQRIVLSGSLPDPLNLPPGCRFNTRCYEKGDICFQQEPQLVETRPGHLVSCHYAR